MYDIHSPHARGDGFGGAGKIRRLHFNPPPSCEGRLAESGCGVSGHDISIRSPHARGDSQHPRWRKHAVISIHSPHARGDKTWEQETKEMYISIHSPLTRGDRYAGNVDAVVRPHFNPLPSHEGRPLQAGKREDIIGISIHSPHTRGDNRSGVFCSPRNHFNPLPSHEGRQHKPPKIHSDLRQLTQQNHDTPLFGALQAPFCGAKPDIRGAKPMGKP